MRRRSNRGPGWARTSGLSAVLIALLGGTALAQSSGESSATIEAVEVRGEAERAEVAIRGQFAVPTYAIRSREDGRVVVIDVADAELPEGGLNATGGSRLVSSTVGSTTADAWLRAGCSTTGEAWRQRTRDEEGRRLLAGRGRRRIWPDQDLCAFTR